MKYILNFILGIFLIVLGTTVLKNTDYKAELVGGGITLLASLIVVDLSLDIRHNFNRLRTWFLSRYLILKKQQIRFSMSYQYRIKVNDHYLLIKNSTWNFYQHVGGKYKRLPISEKIIKEFEGKDDLELETHGKKKDDFAIFIPAKNTLKFLDWFNTRKDREISHWREFHEELIQGKGSVLSKMNFPYVDYNLACTLTTPLKKSPNLKCWEILQYDILDLVLNPEQEKELLELFNNGDTDYIKWAEIAVINKDGHNGRGQPYRIGEHTKWIINEKWSPN